MKCHTDLLVEKHPALERMLTATTHVGMSGKVLRRGSESTSNNLLILDHLLESRRPKQTLEIGMACGASSLLFASFHQRRCAESDENAQGTHLAIDPFQPYLWDSVAVKYLKEENLESIVQLEVGYSSIVLPTLISEKKQYGLIYVDGSHIFEDVFVDMYFCVRLLSDNGLIVFDDCTDPHVKKVIGFLRANLRAVLKEVDLSDAIDNPKRRLRYRVARTIGRTQARAFERVGQCRRTHDASFVNF